MPLTPEDKARQAIDRLLVAAGWRIQDRKDANLSGPGGVAIREFPMPGFGEADYLLFVDGKALGLVEASAKVKPSPTYASSINGQRRRRVAKLAQRVSAGKR